MLAIRNWILAFVMGSSSVGCAVPTPTGSRDDSPSPGGDGKHDTVAAFSQVTIVASARDPRYVGIPSTSNVETLVTADQVNRSSIVLTGDEIRFVVRGRDLGRVLSVHVDGSQYDMVLGALRVRAVGEVEWIPITPRPEAPYVRELAFVPRYGELVARGNDIAGHADTNPLGVIGHLHTEFALPELASIEELEVSVIPIVAGDNGDIDDGWYDATVTVTQSDVVPAELAVPSSDDRLHETLDLCASLVGPIASGEETCEAWFADSDVSRFENAWKSFCHTLASRCVAQSRAQ
jgi:hypothetical protein